jgi:hypothetical protein
MMSVDRIQIVTEVYSNGEVVLQRSECCCDWSVSLLNYRTLG